jgi:3-phytase
MSADNPPHTTGRGAWPPALVVLAALCLVGHSRFGATALPVAEIDLRLAGPGRAADDPCFWVDPSDPDTSLLFVTARDVGTVEVYNAANGMFVNAVTGFGLPSSCAVVDDLLLTTDRKAGEVKVHHIPDLSPVRTFGRDMKAPEGIDVLHASKGKVLVYVTDSGDASVHAYDLRTGMLVRSFQTGSGRDVAPIVVDDLYGRIYVAREERGEHAIAVYTPEGTLVRAFGASVFAHDAEGLAIYACGTAGYLVAADQGKSAAEFEVFDRVSLAHLGTFRLRDWQGRVTDATDGIDILQAPLAGFPNGVLAARHGEQDGMDVVSWDHIAAAMGLDRCPGGAPPTTRTRRRDSGRPSYYARVFSPGAPRGASTAHGA